MDLHFKSTFNVMTKLDLIETCGDVQAGSGLTGANMGPCPCRALQTDGGSGKQGAQPCPFCKLCAPWPGQFSSLSLGLPLCKRKGFKPHELYNFSLLKKSQVLPWEPLSRLCFAICKSAQNLVIGQN